MEFSEIYFNGGIFMHFISLLGIAGIVITVIKLKQFFVDKRFNKLLLNLVLLFGSLALAVGLFSQIIGVVEALSAIAEAGDISPVLVMKGAQVSFYAPIWGFIVFMLLLIFFFTLKEIIRFKQAK